MATVDADALARVLATVDLRAGVAHRAPLSTGEVLPLAAGAMTLVYVADGGVSGHPPIAPGCRVDVDAARSDVAVAADAPRDLLLQGDALLTLGAAPLALRAAHPSTLIVVTLELVDTASPLASVLPDVLTVTGFDDLEPTAATLAAGLGLVDPSSAPVRRTDPVICRLMVLTVLLSVVRAWAENGCAPSGWPSLAGDPFLDRVIDAIHDEPGRDWTVERLASIGAMSRSAFAERFRQAVGRSPADYVTEVRIDRAKRMLDAGQTVSEVSRALGYASDEGFSRAFRRRTGMTPSTWRHTPVTA
ncbi:AraC family transcriptional regulator [uncultured Microbacterium sp.]|uniref:helix-turn-helix transcriptional regulator n=1 Tax=uncultured Microbacterium sp. TaxID=191216 RepID=UPI0028DB06CA|nr:AraC family transcriptional regulator [uncultured Microbacterium sp.]